MPALYKTTVKFLYTKKDADESPFMRSKFMIDVIDACFDPDFSIVDLEITHATNETTCAFSVFGYSYCNSLEDATRFMYKTIVSDYGNSYMRVIDTTTVGITKREQIDPDWRRAFPFTEIDGNEDGEYGMWCERLV